MDPLSEVLRSLRLNASIYCVMDLSAPWGFSMVNTASAPFHFVESGSCWVITKKGRRARLDTGDLVVLFSCEAHRLCDAIGSRAEPLERVLEFKTGNGVVEGYGGGGALTRIICGKFTLDEHEGLPGSFRHLPELLHIRRRSWPQLASFSETLRLFASEFRNSQPGSELARCLLTEMLLIQVFRVLLNGRHTSKGWLQALRDPPIAGTLAAIHDKPEHPWSLESLAAKAGLSRAVFAARFRARLGKTPMAYVNELRLQLASRWLKETDLTVSEVFHRLGYASAAAFNRAFKRKYRRPPSSFKRAHGSPELSS